MTSGKPGGGKLRADALLVEQGLAETRTKARALILAGTVVQDNGALVDKPGTLLRKDAVLRLKSQPLPYVSRGGLKLAAALTHFDVDVRDRVCMDVGASTGGFTDCLLQAGARRVYAIDVGYGQLAWSIRQDPRVVVLERTNVRALTAEQVAELCSVVVVDVSFISLRLVLPPAFRFTDSTGDLVALIKPQFEVGKGFVGKGGIVRDPAARARAVAEIQDAVSSLGLESPRVMDSPILGAKGNHEFLLHARWRSHLLVDLP